MKAFAVLFLSLFLLVACEPADSDDSFNVASDSFSPTLLSDADVVFDRQIGSYQRVGDWVYVHLDIEFRNTVTGQALAAVEILPPFEPADITTVYAGPISSMFSEFGGTSFETAELVLEAGTTASIQVVGHTTTTTLPGGAPLVLGDNQVRKIVGEISYQTTGRFLY